MLTPDATASDTSWLIWSPVYTMGRDLGTTTRRALVLAVRLDSLTTRSGSYDTNRSDTMLRGLESMTTP